MVVHTRACLLQMCLIQQMVQPFWLSVVTRFLWMFCVTWLRMVSKKLRLVLCLLASLSVAFAQSATVGLWLQALLLMLARLLVLLQHSPLVSLVHSLRFVPSTLVVLLRLLILRRVFLVLPSFSRLVHLRARLQLLSSQVL
ncbi:Uncharacterised protein [Chlamydia trachomatis]|nr:Uncharacterised protein [Chlamydia trachomatis]